MRRWLSIFLLVLLPLQLSWAAVSSYCEHESGPGAAHIGHHEHQHQTDAAPAADGPDDAKTASFDFDCGHCHGQCAALPLPLLLLPAVVVGGHGAISVDDLPQAHPSPRPERPQWADLA